MPLVEGFLSLFLSFARPAHNVFHEAYIGFIAASSNDPYQFKACSPSIVSRPQRQVSGSSIIPVDKII